MRTRQRRNDEDRDEPGGDPAGGGPGAGDLEGLRREADELLSAGDEAINRALSRDSRAFLAASRQRGGQ